jgi:hypothetical protein
LNWLERERERESAHRRHDTVDTAHSTRHVAAWNRVERTIVGVGSGYSPMINHAAWIVVSVTSTGSGCTTQQRPDAHTRSRVEHKAPCIASTHRRRHPRPTSNRLSPSSAPAHPVPVRSRLPFPLVIPLTRDLRRRTEELSPLRSISISSIPRRPQAAPDSSWRAVAVHDQPRSSLTSCITLSR